MVSCGILKIVHRYLWRSYEPSVRTGVWRRWLHRSHLVRRLKAEGSGFAASISSGRNSRRARPTSSWSAISVTGICARYPRQGVRRDLSARRRYGRRRLHLHRRARRRHHARLGDDQSERGEARSARGRPGFLLVVGLHLSGRNQLDPDNPNCSEASAYPAAPDSEYGWEKLFSERLYLAYQRNHGVPVRIARFHNVFGPEGTWRGGREKSPAAICRKVAEASDGD